MRFSLRAMFVLVAIAGCGAFGYSRVARQRALVAEIKAPSVGVYYAYQLSEYSSSYSPRIDEAQQKIGRVLGYDVVARPVAICVFPAGVGKPNTDYDRISDCGTRLGTIRWFDASNTTISDADLGKVSGIHTIERFTLGRTPISDEGVRHLGRLPRLRILGLTETNVTDACAPHLANCASLEELDLGITRISDSALMELWILPRLKRLKLYGTSVSDASLPVLAKMRSLRYLNIAQTKVTKRGFDALSASLPNLEITYDREDDDGLLDERENSGPRVGGGRW